MEKREVVILGAGPAGLTAAVYARRAGLDTLLIERSLAGGQVTTTAEVDNWPGEVSISGMDLAEKLHAHAAHFGAEIRMADISGVDFSGDTKHVRTDKGTIQAKAVIIALGAHHKPLGCPGETEFAGKGISFCAVCDAMFYRDRQVAVVGGGNTAAEEAEYLTRFASKVYIVHRRDELRADKMLAHRVLGNPKIAPVWDTVVTEVLGDSSGVTGLALNNVKTGEKSTLKVTGVFIFVGAAPNTAPLGSAVDLTQEGWVITRSHDLATSVPGVFAAGDVRDKALRQLVTAASDGAYAAMAAYKYIVAL